MQKLRAWIKAARPPSQTYIAFPILFGQMIWLARTGEINWIAFVLAQLFGLFDQLYIVFANDWADLETDRRNNTFNIFSGGSRVLVEGMLKRRELGTAAVLMATLALATGVGLWLLNGTSTSLVAMAVGINDRKSYLAAQPRNGCPGRASTQNTATITVRAVTEEWSPAM